MSGRKKKAKRKPIYVDVDDSGKYIDPDLFDVEEIVGTRVISGVTQYRVKWENYPSSKNTWEPEENIIAKCLIDKFNKTQEKKLPQEELTPRNPSKKDPMEEDRTASEPENSPDVRSTDQDTKDDVNSLDLPNHCTEFVNDEVSALVYETIENILTGKIHSDTKIRSWTSSIVDGSLIGLTSLQKPFKYIVNCTIIKKSGAGLHTGISCFWDNATDGYCTVRYENDSMFCVVSVFGLAM